jgi:hypothetical protein
MMGEEKGTVKNYCPVITVVSEGLYLGYTVKLNGETAYYRPYSGLTAEEVAEEFCETLGQLVREKLGYPKEMPGAPEYE